MSRRSPPAALLLVLASAPLAGCGGASPAAESTTTRAGPATPPALAAARDERRCTSLAADQACTDYDTIESWYRDGQLEAGGIAGAVEFVKNGCGSCHVYRDIGMQNIDAPELTHEGAASDASKITRAIVCPSCAKSGAKMPPFESLPKESVRELAAFLAASR